uniref:ymf68 n=1 Tax=Cryptocaryon irritans TaxID=153251 RepID=UPI0022FD7222|nr:ymf68 [Cryptocaryon irritans]WBP62330.1 ymf68 [Cryptocaryon irritans]
MFFFLYTNLIFFFTLTSFQENKNIIISLLKSYFMGIILKSILFIYLKKFYQWFTLLLKYKWDFLLINVIPNDGIKKKKHLTKKKNSWLINIGFFSHKKFKKLRYIFLDVLYVFFFKISLFGFFSKNRFSIREEQTLLIQIYKHFGYFNNLNFLLNGFISFWKFFRFWFLGGFLMISFFYYFLLLRSLPFQKIFFIWFSVSMLFYLLISGFVFFIKKYRTSKYTSAIQRFWRRSLALFWLIEIFLFLIFFYLTLNANNESFYMLDPIQTYKTHLFSWRVFLFKIIPITLIIVLSYFSLIILKWNIFSKNNLFFFFITLLLIYVVWVEFYQFFHLVSFYNNFFWIYDYDDHLWFLESDSKRTRIVNNYVTICLIAKFWHVIFIFIFWIFFLLRGNELNMYNYPILSSNIQNFLMLYILSWIYMYPWIKFVLRRFLNIPYFWFYTSPRFLFFRVFFNDLKILYFSLINFFSNNLVYLNSFKQSPFYYFIESSYNTNYVLYYLHHIRCNFLEKLLTIL